MEKFRNLIVWQKAHQLVLDVYHLTLKFPSDEKFGLISQMRRSAVSVAANIVEATKRKTIKDRSNFHLIADASLEELKYYFILSLDLNFIAKQQEEKATEQCREPERRSRADLKWKIFRRRPVTANVRQFYHQVESRP